jgi:hypothetical protein
MGVAQQDVVRFGPLFLPESAIELLHRTRQLFDLELGH